MLANKIRYSVGIMSERGEKKRESHGREVKEKVVGKKREAEEKGKRGEAEKYQIGEKQEEEKR